VSETARELLRRALTAKLATELGRPHRASAEAVEAGRYAALLVEELAPDRARGTDEELGADDADDLELEEPLEARYPRTPVYDDGDGPDEPGGPT